MLCNRLATESSWKTECRGNYERRVTAVCARTTAAPTRFVRWTSDTFSEVFLSATCEWLRSVKFCNIEIGETRSQQRAQSALPNLPVGKLCVLDPHWGPKCPTQPSVIRPLGFFPRLLLTRPRPLAPGRWSRSRALLSNSRPGHAQLIDWLRQLRLFARVNLGLIPRLD